MNPLVAVAQMKSSDNIESNFTAVERLCEQAKMRGACLVCFPENFAFMPTLSTKPGSMAEPLTGSLFCRYQSLASRFELEISFGGFQERDSDGRQYNTHIVVNPQGDIISTYRKIHLFVVDLPDGTQFNEAATCQAGDRTVVAEGSFAKLGLSICYDLRFAELYQALLLQGAQLMLVPAAFTAETGKAHWDTLLRARAIENQCYVLAAAQYGLHSPGRSTHGHAMIVDPWGTIIAQCSNTEGIAIAEIDLSYVKRVRASMPTSTHKRPDLFSRLH